MSEVRSWLTVKQAAFVVGRSVTTLYKWIDDGSVVTRKDEKGVVLVQHSSLMQTEALTRRGRPGKDPTQLFVAVSHDPVIYYIRFSDRFKIGTTTTVGTRLSQLPWDAWEAFELGGQTAERKRHAQFEATRVRGHNEWFHSSPELVALIEKLRESNGDPLEHYQLRPRRVD